MSNKETSDKESTPEKVIESKQTHKDGILTYEGCYKLDGVATQ